MTLRTAFNTISRMLLPLCACALLFTVGCDKDDSTVAPSKAGTFDGPAVALGNGTLSAYVELDDAGTPVKLGIRIKEAVLTGLPMSDSMNIVTLRFPSQASGLPFTHAMVDWLPHGHPPAGIYDAPHFDMHFFLITETERLAITTADTIRGRKQPDASLIPPNFVPAPEIFPTIGTYWVDITGPEFNGVPFTRTMQYGFWDGRQVFIQTVMSKAFLETKQTVTDPVQQPAAFSKSGLFPTKYTIRFDAVAKEWLIALNTFVNH